MVPILLLLGGLACAPARTQASPDSCPSTPPSATMFASFDADLVLQSLSLDREGDPTGFRVHADGRLDRRRRGSEWGLERTLPPERMEALKRAIEASNFPEGVFRPTARVMDATSLNLQVRRAGALVQVSRQSGCTVAGLDEFYKELAPLLE